MKLIKVVVGVVRRTSLAVLILAHRREGFIALVKNSHYFPVLTW